MRELDYAWLRERLLRGGVAPKHVRRMIAELRDHHADLFAEAFSGGCSMEDAEMQAAIRLGDADTLAAEIIARPELRSWMSRWPWIAYGVTPPLALLLALFGILLILGRSGAFHADLITFTNRWGSPDSWSWFAAIRVFYTFGLPLLLAAGCCFVAGQRRAALRWPVMGAMLVSIFGAAVTFNVCWPHGADSFGGLCIRSNVFPPFAGWEGNAVRAAATSALSVGPYLWWKRRLRDA